MMKAVDAKVVNTTVITMDQVRANGYNWRDDNDCEFKGIVPGYICGWNVEVQKGGKIDYCSCTFTNDYEQMFIPGYWDGEWHCDYNELGISADLASTNGWEVTGNIAFRGYFTEHYDWEEREEYYTDASKEVVALFNKYCVA